MRAPFAAGCVAGAFWLCLIGAHPTGADASEPLTLTSLSGRWAGEGKLTPGSGPVEAFKCVVTYFASDDSSQLRQNLRCHGPSTKFDAATRLQIIGQTVIGQWSDNIYSLSGSVKGSVTDKGLSLRLLGSFFNGTMTVTSSGCEQSVKVVPDKPDQMRELAATLKKC